MVKINLIIQIFDNIFPDGIDCELSRGKLSVENESRELNATMKLALGASAEPSSEVTILLKIVSCGDGQCKMETLKAILKITRFEGGQNSLESSFSFEIR
jgi:hypothetical protein